MEEQRMVVRCNFDKSHDMRYSSRNTDINRIIILNTHYCNDSFYIDVAESYNINELPKRILFNLDKNGAEELFNDLKKFLKK